MSKLRLSIYLMLFVLAACAGTNSISNAEAPEDLMDSWVGTWNVEVTLKKSLLVPEEKNLEGTETVKWILNKKFLQSTQSLAGGAFKKLSLMRYEPNGGVFLFWDFDSNGSFPMGITYGKWDKSKNEIALSGEYLGATGEGVVQLDGDDKMKVVFTVQTEDGTVLLDLEASSERSK